MNDMRALASEAIARIYAMLGDSTDHHVCDGDVAALLSALILSREREADAAELLRETASSGVEHEDPRISYVTVQIDVETWRLIRAFAEKSKETP